MLESIRRCRRFRKALCVVFVSGFPLSSCGVSPTQGEEGNDPSFLARTCYARHLAAPQPVVPVYGDDPTISFYAYATWRSDGWPIIMLGPKYYAAPRAMREFVLIHECAHVALPTSDEIVANCTALQYARSFGMSAADETTIAGEHSRQGTVGFQYGGTGAAFWQLTVACAGPRVASLGTAEASPVDESRWLAFLSMTSVPAE